MILYIFTIILSILGVLFSSVYIWLNIFSERTMDIGVRNNSILKMLKAVMVLTVIFAMLSCLLGNPGNAGHVIASTAWLYSFIAVCWLVVIPGCAVALGIALVARARFREGALRPLTKLLYIAIAGSVINLALSWLLS